MAWRELLFGRPIPSVEAHEQKIGVAAGIPVLGLDALASASYGPEAALAIFLAADASGLNHIRGLMVAVVAVLLVVQLSYRQTIAAYPGGGGSYTVAKTNLGTRAGLLAAAALFLDYILNVGVAISAGVGAVVSAVPSLLPFTLPLCLGLLALLTVINLRGVRSAGLVFMFPTYLFVVSVGGVLLLGVVKALAAGGSPEPMVRPPQPPETLGAVGLWVLARAFSSGCTAMTGVEAVSNAVPIFKEPQRRSAQRTLSSICVILGFFLLSIGVLARAYHVRATTPGEPGYESVLSQLTAAVVGRGPAYYVTLASIFAVLCLSANTSFADFPRLCRVLAVDRFLPEAFGHQGRRLVYSVGVLLLSAMAALLLVLFRGLTDHLIPLFAVGAFTAFTLSQLGMVAHWRRERGRGWKVSLALNALGAAATAFTLAIIIASKLLHGAWLSVALIAAMIALFLAVRRKYDHVSHDTGLAEGDVITTQPAPIVVVPLKRLDKLAAKALELAFSISRDVRVVQIRTHRFELDDLPPRWRELVVAPAQAKGLPAPALVVRRSKFRRVIDPLLTYIAELRREQPDRYIAVMVPEVVERRWYHFLLHSHTATLLKFALLFRGGPRVVLISTPWYVDTPKSAMPEATAEA